MTKRILLCVSALAVGCGPAEDQSNQEEAAAAATVSLADFAGTWSVTAESNDSLLLTYELHATETMDGWTSTNPDGEPVPVRVVQVAGDSVVLEAGPYESALRPGMMATSRTVARLEGGMLMGTIVVQYGADDVPPLTGQLHGMRNSP